jgi:hypothetical protein
VARPCRWRRRRQTPWRHPPASGNLDNRPWRRKTTRASICCHLSVLVWGFGRMPGSREPRDFASGPTTSQGRVWWALTRGGGWIGRGLVRGAAVVIIPPDVSRRTRGGWGTFRTGRAW